MNIIRFMLVGKKLRVCTFLHWDMDLILSGPLLSKYLVSYFRIAELVRNRYIIIGISKKIIRQTSIKKEV